ncbi:MAG: hypothetical protein WCE64_09085 [Bacteroidales bacterium]
MSKNLNTINNQIHISSPDTGGRSIRINDDNINGVIETKSFAGRAGRSPAIFTLLTEGGINFFRYLKILGLSGEPNLIVLSSRHHYYFDENDLKSVRVVVNLKKLNQIKYLDMFFDTLFRILPQDASFIGYFSDIKSLKVNGVHLKFITWLYNRLANILSFRAEHILDENKVSELLKKRSYNMTNMIRMNGLIYFCSQSKIHHKVELNPLQSAG